MPADLSTAEQPLAGRYELQDLLGCGATGEVRAGWDRHLDRPVAVKLMRTHMAADPVLRRRFDVEAQAAGRLSHPNVVTVYDTGDPGPSSTPYIVMERLSGATLRDAIAAGPLSVVQGRELAVQMLAALSVAHRAGLVHRDIKPSNVLSAAPGHWKVADFGIAKTVDSGNDETTTGLVVGTPAYLAPERLYGQPATVASDLFSVGVVLFEALTGRRPFDTPSAYPWSGAVGGSPALQVRSLRPDIDPVLAGVIDRALQLDPRERFPSAAAMAAALVPRAADVALSCRSVQETSRGIFARAGMVLTGAGVAATVGFLLLSGAPTSAARFGTAGSLVRPAPNMSSSAAVAPASTASAASPSVSTPSSSSSASQVSSVSSVGAAGAVTGEAASTPARSAATLSGVEPISHSAPTPVPSTGGVVAATGPAGTAEAGPHQRDHSSHQPNRRQGPRGDLAPSAASSPAKPGDGGHHDHGGPGSGKSAAGPGHS